jgi:hypothetical protein
MDAWKTLLIRSSPNAPVQAEWNRAPFLSLYRCRTPSSLLLIVLDFGIVRQGAVQQMIVLALQMFVKE